MNAARRALAALAAVPVLGAAVPLTPVPAAAAPPALTARSVSITISDVTPNTPKPTTAPSRLDISFSLHNRTGRTINPVTVTVERSDPIATTAQLDAAIAHPHPPTPSLVSPVHTAPLDVGALVPHGTIDEVYRTSTSTTAGAGVCLCYQNFIYPLYVVATYTDPSTGQSTVVGTAQTYIPSFTTKPAPLDVSWVWPLLDRPHRIGSDRYFTDDDLAAEFATGGRLDRALSVAEQVAGRVQMTLLVDPDLLDEAEVMAAGGYRVFDAKAASGSVLGTGSTSAKLWLDRFRTLVVNHPDLEVQLTPYADPDVDALARNGLTWNSSTLAGSNATEPQLARDRLDDALGDRPVSSTLAWPVGGTLGTDTLAELVRRGVQTVLLSDSALPRGRSATNINALAPVQTADGPVLAAVTSAKLETYVNRVLAPQGTGLGLLPQFVAELAVRALTSKVSTFVVLTPSREVDTDPEVAVRTILATSATLWSRSLSLADATGTVLASDHGQLRPGTSSDTIPPDAIEDLRAVQQALPQLTGPDGLLAPRSSGPASAAVARVARLPVSVQRTASSELLHYPKAVLLQAHRLAVSVDRLRAGVRLVQPRGNGSYTLTANDAPLPVTVTNTLDAPVRISVHVAAVGNLPGFAPQSMDVTMPANATQQLRLPTRIDLTGRIRVEVTLSSRTGMALGTGPLLLSVRNTALGTVGVAITTIAAGVLALALLIRLIRAIRWRRRRRRTGPPEPVTDPLAP